MLPLIKSLEFSKILPLSKNTVEKISFNDGVNKFLAENGSGKTTLTDLIEHSLVRDAHAFAWNVFSKKRVDRTAYVRAEWVFGDQVSSILHEFTDAGARTRVTSSKFSNKAHTRDMYSDLLRDKTNLDLEQLQKMFEGVYYKRENDLNLLGTPGEEDLMAFFELLNKAIRMETPATIKLRNQIGELRRQIDIRRSKKRQIEATLEKMEIIFAGTDSSAEALDNIGSRKGQLELNKTKLIEDFERDKNEILKLEEDDQEIIDQLDHNQELLIEIRAKSDNLKSERYTLKTQLDQLKKELEGFQKIGNINYQEIKESWKEKQNCNLCGSLIYDYWNERLSSGCPVCGTDWKRIPKTIKEAVATDQKSLTQETRNIAKEIESLTHSLRTVEEDLEKTIKKEEETLKKLKTFREKLG
jgi:hypothetical protein